MADLLAMQPNGVWDAAKWNQTTWYLDPSAGKWDEAVWAGSGEIPGGVWA